ncbi:MAG TPA: homoserine dehydrogenase [bacterium]|nr:homoserine dehydrogenase [bacterium]
MANVNVNIGIIGFGTVGTGAAKILLEKKKELKEKTGINFCLKKIADLDIKKERNIKIDKNILTTDVNEIVNDETIDIVVELIGGINPAKTIILNSLKNKKNVVTANKALLSEYADLIFQTAAENNRIVKFEASVCGGIPILKILSDGLTANRILNIYGIVNGTANYILTNMSKYGKSFDEALKEAQAKGFAEADPTFDIKGNDSVHKLAILATLGYGINVKAKDIYCEGITEVTALDLKYAHKLDYEIKLLAIAKLHNHNLDLRVHPTLIPQKSMLAKTDFENNAIYITGDAIGPLMLYGKGAGMMPTASAVVADVIDIAKKIVNNSLENGNYYFNKQPLNIHPMFALKTKYYLRFSAKDKTYVLANIAKVLSDSGISIASLLQTETNEDGSAVIVIMTHPAIEKSMISALEALNKLSVIQGKVFALRVEDEF